jgi:CopA family copper-resistance protein
MNSSEELPRRKFIKGLTAGAISAALLTTGILPTIAWSAQPIKTLSGKEFSLSIGEKHVNITGKNSIATLVNDSLPGPVLRIQEGDDVVIHVTNNLSEMTTIHWHGIILDTEMDGVPGISFTGIAPGETFTYRFKAVQHGTYWYHAHTLAEQTGLYGALIVDPKDNSSEESVDRDYPVILSDWTDEAPIDVFLNLKKMGGYYNYQQLTVQDFIKDVANVGFSQAIASRKPWNKARMSPADFNDVSAATYTYLMNGSSPNANWHGEVKAGEKVKLRFIGAATGTFFDVRIPGLQLKVIATDGQAVHPVVVDEFRIGPGETYDVIVVIPDAKPYTIFAQSMDRSGYTRGTLSLSASEVAEVPEMDAVELLTMGDMMGDMNAMAGMDEMSNMKGMNDMNTSTDMLSMTKSEMANMSMAESSMHKMKSALAVPSKNVRHASTEYGAGVDMRVDTPRMNLDDPGPGLRKNGRKVLTYADLHSLAAPTDNRLPSREIELHLTGNMERFIWSIDGLKLNEAKPLHFPLGQRIRVILHNDTNMLHPMHLHGMWSDLETQEGDFQVRKHTITVQPAQRVSFLVTVDAPGRWAFHCHLLYHMAAGMFREVVVA